MVRAELADGGTSLRFFDAVENASVRMDFDGVVVLDEVDDPLFPVVVDHAVRVCAERITIQTVPEIAVRDGDGRPVRIGSSGERPLRRDQYVIEVSSPLKLYVAVTAAVTLTESKNSVDLTLGQPTRITIGARVPRSTPSATVRTTHEVTDLFDAVSTFGSAIRSWGPGRSYPSVRGHPPRIEIGDSLEIPSSAEPPDTGVRLELPSDPASVAVASPLAYYLGARLVRADRPALLANGAPLLPFDPEASLGRQCSELLDRVLFLDSLARRDWKYEVQLSERDRIGDRLDVDWDRLAEDPYPERLRSYLAIPIGSYRDLIPDWRRSFPIIPTDRGISSLPYLAYDLAELREPRELISRGGDIGHAVASDGGLVVPRGPAHGSRFVEEATDRRPPIGLDSAFPAAFENRLTRGDDPDAINVVMVCNDEKMVEELDYAWSAYERHDDPFVSARRYQRLSCRELRELLCEPIDFFYYIGHIEEPGFICSDGFLDIGTVDTVGVEVAFLNACESRTQGISLIAGGCAAVIATRAKVLNEPAVRVGQQVAELLISGFPVGYALDLVRPHRLIGHQYTVLGDPSIAITQAESGVPYCCRIERTAEGAFVVTVWSMLTSVARAGTAVTFRISDDLPYYLNPTRRTFPVDRETLETFLAYETVPVLVEDELRWSDEPIDCLVHTKGDGDRSS